MTADRPHPDESIPPGQTHPQGGAGPPPHDFAPRGIAISPHDLTPQMPVSYPYPQMCMFEEVVADGWQEAAPSGDDCAEG